MRDSSTTRCCLSTSIFSPRAFKKPWKSWVWVIVGRHKLVEDWRCGKTLLKKREPPLSTRLFAQDLSTRLTPPNKQSTSSNQHPTSLSPTHETHKTRSETKLYFMCFLCHAIIKSKSIHPSNQLSREYIYLETKQFILLYQHQHNYNQLK
jgi:hypothetical protein